MRWATVFTAPVSSLETCILKKWGCPSSVRDTAARALVFSVPRPRSPFDLSAPKYRCHPILRYRKGRNPGLLAPWPYANGAISTMRCCRLFPVRGKAGLPRCSAYPERPNRLPETRPSAENGCGVEPFLLCPSFAGECLQTYSRRRFSR